MSFRLTDFFPDPYDAVSNTGRWRRLRVLGSGGLAVVYLAEDMTGGLGKVALKVLRSQAQPVHAFELHREAFWSLTKLHCLEHPHYDSEMSKLFVKYFEDHTGFRTSKADFDEHRRQHEADHFDWSEVRPLPGRPYVVMEYLPGQALWAILNPKIRAETKTPAITPEERQLILVQVAKACVYLQKHQLIHRDLRPCNVQICRRGRRCQVKILDFGVMIAAERSLRQCQSSAVRVFGANRTPQDGYDWLPPEVDSSWAGWDADDAADFQHWSG
ncbi:unnamed protein product [Cladocopium goreaui]|uniref:Protein kinase domain-containing protein n=1 Tax=Cladocopium goreaui TaxID=2562237 RepID=A0A9P1CRN7_9DINO|nr:unnamed protein product [Cladocopium goreaui]